MAHDKLIDSAKLDGAMTATADAIRGKTGKTADIPWNESTGFASEIASIPTETEPNLQAKTATPSTSAQTVKPDSGYDGLSQVTVNAMPTATQATPSISVSSAGLITAAATQTAGYVAAGTKSATKQLTTQAAKTITPSTADQNAVASGVYTTGAVTVKGDANLKAENIAKGASIFGITGTHAGGGNVATGYALIQYSSQKKFTVSGLGFTPSNLILMLDFYSTLAEGQGAALSGHAAMVLGVMAGEWNMCQFVNTAGTLIEGEDWTTSSYISLNVSFKYGSFTVETASSGSFKFKIGGAYRYVAW